MRVLPWILGATLTAPILVDGCTCGKAEDPAAALLDDDKLVVRRVPDTNLVLSIPKGWIVDLDDPGPMPPPPADASKVELRTRMLLVAKPGTAAPGTLVAPRLMVLEDPWLPVGTTGVDYLVAQRAANQRVIGSNIRHVDAEPSRRDGRPSYHIRDEFTVQAGGGSRDLSQEALLLLETATTPDGKPAMHGYTVVLTLEKAEFTAMHPTIRAVLASVRFDAREQKKPAP